METEKADITEVRWAPPVRQTEIRQLYEMDARGIYDEELIENVGLALYLRCRSILAVTAANDQGQIRCPRCARLNRETIIERVGSEKDTVVRCEICGWQVTWGEYHQTFQGKSLTGGNALDVFQTFLPAYDRARSAREKIIAIDRLIHTFHGQLSAMPSAPAARNLIEGRLTDVLAFLNDLTYGPQNAPEVLAMRTAYEETLTRSMVSGHEYNSIKIDGVFRKPPKQRPSRQNEA